MESLNGGGGEKHRLAFPEVVCRPTAPRKRLQRQITLSYTSNYALLAKDK